MRRILLCSCLIVLWTLWEVGEAPAEQGNAMRAPTTPQRTARLAASAPESTLPAQVFDAYLASSVTSPVDGARSNMYPTGSA
jgi:hypothetical protein